ncbi:unnamed protein product [Paramecium sonneborni]|uniref:RING-type E3 ubiquitin transferase n=1 Tax=Paramecium sonneborni TaxID=65129 RepID=A0A8S1LK80_9CILI|nr:unnamed protein product [Paramecium sonneborni]
MISKEDYLCSICLGIFIDPCRLKCQHVFCQSCLLDLIDFHNIKYKCPMCRVEFINKENPLIIDLELQAFVQNNFPNQYQQRVEEQKIIRSLLPNELKIEVNYGNYYKFEDDEDDGLQHQWTVHVSLDYTKQSDKIALNNLDLNSLIKNVTFTLDETFFPDVITVRQPPFLLTRWGWDVFTIPIKIKFKKEHKIQPIELEHHLVFEDDGIEKRQIVKIDISNLSQFQVLKQNSQQQLQQQQ